MLLILKRSKDLKSVIMFQLATMISIFQCNYRNEREVHAIIKACHGHAYLSLSASVADQSVMLLIKENIRGSVFTGLCHTKITKYQAEVMWQILEAAMRFCLYFHY